MRRNAIGRRVLVLAAAFALVAAPSPHDAAAGDRKVLDDIRALLAAGKADEALAKAKQTLVAAGDDVDVLDLASDAAAAAKSPDEALWFEHAARYAAVRSGKDDRARALAAKADTLEPPDLGERAPIDAATAAQLETARLCVRKRYWVNAVQILSRLESTALDAKAESDLEKIYANKQAVTALLDSRISVPRTVTDRKARAKSAKDDAGHATWDTAAKFETPSYTVVTDAGFEVGDRIATAMEPMNRFYRRVFHFKDKPGEKSAPIPRCTVRIFRTRAEMYATVKYDRNVLGFYSPGDNTVTAYDPRSEGMPLASLWSTLFHECSHQFTAMICGQPVPSWLNEGTASYFEGAALRADGRVETNLVPSYRLEGCMEALGSHSPTVREVLSYSKPESYPDDYYPVGWALVYFLRNYQDDRLQKVYEKPYAALLDSYRTTGGLPSFERFVKYVVTDVKQPGIATFDAWEDRFERWMTNLQSFHAGPPIAANDFADRAGKHLSLGHKEEAEDDFRYSLQKNPDLHVALVGLGELLATTGRKDEAIACFRRAAETLRRDATAAGYSVMKPANVEELARAAIARAAKLDPEMSIAFTTMNADLATKVLAQAEKYVAAKMPRNALRVLDAASVLLTGQGDLEDRRREIAQESNADVLMPRALDMRPGAERVWSSEGWTVDGPRLVAPKSRASLLLFDAGLGDRYRFEATVTPGAAAGDNPFAGLVVGADAEGEWACVGISGDIVGIWKVFASWERMASPRTLTAKDGKSIRLTIEARPRLLRVYVNGELTAEEEFQAGALRGGVGLLVDDASAAFEDIRLAY